MDEEHTSWAASIQKEAERLTLKRLREDKEERDRQRAEEAQAAQTQSSDKKKA